MWSHATVALLARALRPTPLGASVSALTVSGRSGPPQGVHMQLPNGECVSLRVIRAPDEWRYGKRQAIYLALGPAGAPFPYGSRLRCDRLPAHTTVRMMLEASGDEYVFTSQQQALMSPSNGSA